MTAPAAESVPTEPAVKKIRPQEATVIFAGAEAQLFDTLRLGASGVKLKKSVVLRAALAALAEVGEERVAQLVAGLAPVKKKRA